MYLYDSGQDTKTNITQINVYIKMTTHYTHWQLLLIPEIDTMTHDHLKMNDIINFNL